MLAPRELHSADAETVQPKGENRMTESRDASNAAANLFNWPLSPMLGAPLMTVLADINGKLLESAASAQKDWADFVHQRVKEDIATSQQLMSCKSLDDMQQVY